jgi:hypothetical protein
VSNNNNGHISWYKKYLKMKSTVFWNVMPYSLVVVNQHFGGMYCLYLQGYRVIQTRNQQKESRKLDSLFDPEDGDRMFLQNVDGLLLAL